MLYSQSYPLVVAAKWVGFSGKRVKPMPILDGLSGMIQHAAKMRESKMLARKKGNSVWIA